MELLLNKWKTNILWIIQLFVITAIEQKYIFYKELHVIQIHKDFSFNRDFCSSQYFL